MTPEKPVFLTPKKIGLAFLVALVLVAVTAVFLLSPVSAGQAGKLAAEKECKEAANWHYGEAIKANPDAEYHFWAGAAAEKLAATGGSCSDWRGPA